MTYTQWLLDFVRDEAYRLLDEGLSLSDAIEELRASAYIGPLGVDEQTGVGIATAVSAGKVLRTGAIFIIGYQDPVPADDARWP